LQPLKREWEECTPTDEKTWHSNLKVKVRHLFCLFPLQDVPTPRLKPSLRSQYPARFILHAGPTDLPHLLDIPHVTKRGVIFYQFLTVHDVNTQFEFIAILEIKIWSPVTSFVWPIAVRLPIFGDSANHSRIAAQKKGNTSQFKLFSLKSRLT
jgi:hypothetical protein